MNVLVVVKAPSETTSLAVNDCSWQWFANGMALDVAMLSKLSDMPHEKITNAYKAILARMDTKSCFASLAKHFR